VKKPILILFFLIQSYMVNSQIITFGPMFHYYFSLNSKTKFTFGLETAIYFTTYSIDFGLEAEKYTNFIYCELQFVRVDERNDYIPKGMSFGIYRRKGKENEPVFGLQTTIWESYYVGADLRLKIDMESLSIGPGVFGKLFFPYVRI